MEKIIIKPDTKEIVLRGKPEDGHVDVFSYNYDGSSSNNLGGLFIVGQVQPASEDTSYMINLVASLAKREYYSKTDIAPKEAFSTTLKKINEVLQDFFKKKDLDVNIGIFAVTGESIFISRLGKFKIFLARDNQNVDILNNINLFNKEHIQEKEFSNVISGKIIPKDKIFAFYAGRSITARERNIKDNFLKLEAGEFSEKLNSIKQSNDNFTCAAIHLTINKYKESAVIKSPQPRELRKSESYAPEPMASQAILTKATKAPQASKIDTSRELPSVQLAEATAMPEISRKIESPSTPDEPTSSGFSPSMESPIIRPTEFSSAKKSNLLDVILKKFKPSGVYIIGVGQGRGLSKKKMIITGSTIVAVLAFLVVAKFTFIPSLPIPGIESSQDKALSALISGIRSKIESAGSYKDQNNLFDARRLLFESLNALASSATPDSEKIEKIRQDAVVLLDEIDKAVEFSPSLLQDISQVLGDDFQAWSFAWSLTKGEMKIQKPDVASMISLYPSQDNLYILASEGLFKITDANKGKNNAVSWLNKDAKLPSASLLLAVDSKIFVLAENGVLATFYKGDKVSEVNTSIPVNKESILLTTTDSASLYLVDKEYNRIYLINKDSGSVTKTLKIPGDPFIIDGSMGEDQTIFLISKDNKVWKVTP